MDAQEVVKESLDWGGEYTRPSKRPHIFAVHTIDAGNQKQYESWLARIARCWTAENEDELVTMMRSLNNEAAKRGDIEFKILAKIPDAPELKLEK